MTSGDARTLLRGAGLRPKKSFGQHFLVSEKIARAIAAACVPDAEMGRARVVEIGAGTGTLTRLLAARTGALVAIERDRDLIPLLESEFGSSRVRVVEADAKAVDFAVFLGERDIHTTRVLCGNLPYALTGPLLRQCVVLAANVERVVFMVQREVADRLLARPGTKGWGALSVFVRAAFDVRSVLRVDASAFHPRPDVASTVVELRPLRPALVQEGDTFRELVRRAFAARRKKLRNAWAGLAPEPAALELAAVRAEISLDVRGETLDVAAFGRMVEALGELPLLAPPNRAR